MNDNLWTAIKIPSVIDPDSEYGIMYFGNEKRNFKQHTVLTNSDGVKFALFCTSVDDPVDAIYPELTKDNTLEEVFTEIKAYLIGFTQSAVMLPGLASQLYETFVVPTLATEEI